MITYRGGERDTADRLIFLWRADHSENSDCKFHGVFYTELAAQHALDTHQCPEPFTGWGYKFMGIAEKLWVELDEVVDWLKFYATEPTPEVLRKQGRAQGLAFALVLICQPYYADEKAVSREANERWKMRNGQAEYRPTPGFKYDPPIPGTPRYSQEHLGTTDGVTPATYTQDHNSTDEAPTSGRRRRAAITKPVKVLSEFEKQTIRKTGGAFPAKDLAGMYGVTEETIKAVLATV